MSGDTRSGGGALAATVSALERKKFLREKKNCFCLSPNSEAHIMDVRRDGFGIVVGVISNFLAKVLMGSRK